jgi:hypothetical protein
MMIGLVLKSPKIFLYDHEEIWENSYDFWIMFWNDLIVQFNEIGS